ncbi:MAG: enoyl-CoA hydratase/isomerase family protein [Chloroflexi bacterium]|nr:enoyl-CoA hydratase/isomerase family protein [Chloroflexota bacterium]
MIPFETVRFSKANGVAHLVLDRPHVINAYNLAMRDEMWQALTAVRDDPDVRAVVLSGAGERGFCAGADLTEFGTAPSQAIARQVRFERGLWELWLSIPKPFVAAVHGWCLGSGVEMALLCDLRLAAEGTTFRLPEVALGMVPAAGGTQTLPRTVGVAPALEVLLTARTVDAAEALRMGLVQRVLPRERLLEEAQAVAKRLAGLPPHIVPLLKAALRNGLDLPLAAALALEERLALQALMEVAGRRRA